MMATKFWTILTCAMLCATFTSVSRAEAAEIEGIHFDDRYRTADTSLELRGTGLLRVMVFAKIYVAALYLPEDHPSKLALSDVPKRLEVQYLRSVAGKDFGPATNKKVSENVDPQTFERLLPRLEYHNSLYQDVQAGDRYALTYIPGKGTELTLNGEPQGTIEGADFAAALF
ncbi:MAG: chalcone isomerase family protein, partial [Deltaproteobacteria bacterium]|nr:chalcone isomerase family protein [Deltaproteobacteria bacterium]